MGLHAAHLFCPPPWLQQQIHHECDQHNEFRALVKVLYEADIEVILDVVYNHTAEGDQRGPVYSYKGIDNSTYYLMSGPAGKSVRQLFRNGQFASVYEPMRPQTSRGKRQLLDRGVARRRLAIRPGLRPSCVTMTVH